MVTDVTIITVVMFITIVTAVTSGCNRYQRHRLLLYYDGAEIA